MVFLIIFVPGGGGTDMNQTEAAFLNGDFFSLSYVSPEAPLSFLS